MKKPLFLDCDSTLCAIEGVDELAALRGAETEQKVIDLTNQAMDGKIAISDIFGARLDLIQPTRKMCEAVGEIYIQRLSDGVEEGLSLLRNNGWEPIIISGGFTQVIEPVAQKLGITTIHAVNLYFYPEGNYLGYEQEAPTARNGGKPEIIQEHLSTYPSDVSVMVGDGISDLETKEMVTLFVGYGGVVAREAVIKGSEAFIYSFKDLSLTLDHYLE